MIVIEQIAEAPRDFANGSLELSSMILEAWAAGEDIEPLRPTVESWVKSIKITPGKYKRSPFNIMQSSHDEALGLAVLSKLYDLNVAAEILDNLDFGLWITGQAHDKILGIPIDSEYFTFWRPSYRAVMKLAAGRPITSIEKWFLESNLTLSTTWNLLRIRLLFLSYMGFKDLDYYKKRLGDKYKGRYGSNPIYLKLWELNHGRYSL